VELTVGNGRGEVRRENGQNTRRQWKDKILNRKVKGQEGGRGKSGKKGQTSHEGQMTSGGGGKGELGPEGRQGAAWAKVQRRGPLEMGTLLRRERMETLDDGAPSTGKEGGGTE